MASNDELKEIASQLRQPEGTKGIEVADMMHETNIRMTLHSIDRLNIREHDNILELGHGNCGHLDYLLKQNEMLTYSGLEMSELMHSEARRINQVFTDRKQASFYLYDGLNMPFPDNMFDKIFTVNTIYFWTQPESLMLELYRVIKPGGMLNITFAQKSFMQQLPFVQYGFELYDEKKLAALAEKSPFKITASDTQTEMVKSKTGELVNRAFTTVTLMK